MTRSDNPFGDLPEWKERRRLQEAQAQGEGHPNSYSQPHDQGYAPQGTLPDPGSYAVDPGAAQSAYPPGYDDGRSAPQETYYQHPQPTAPGHDQYAQPAPQAGQPALHYNVGQGAPVGYDAANYDRNGQTAYPADVVHPVGEYQPGPPTNNPAGAPAGFGEHVPGGDGQYDASQYTAATASYNPGQYGNPGQYAPGHPPAGAPGYYDAANPQGGDDFWAAAPVGAAAATHDPLSHDAVSDDDEDYYDDDEDDGQRYSWKLLAAVVVTGAVVTGGGVVLYNSFTGGGLSKNGDAPIIRAGQGPSKTAPKDAGGRQFANRDSKLLGRLDSANGSSKTRPLPARTDDNRVRTVPTVRIGRDGRLILPKAPESVANSASASGSAVPSTPGINVVDSLNGNSRPAFGGLPAAVPKSAAPVVRAPAIKTAAVPKAVQPAVQAARAPIIKNRGVANRATVRQAVAPPVPSKSSLGSAWRSTRAQAAAEKKPQVGRIRPTIAQPRQPIQTPRTTASTLGAGAVASRSKGYVAVLATESTRVKALQSFAEIQQKHPQVLLNRVPDVQAADLKARGLGIMYRLVVGPASSRSAANSVCSSLKSAGYRGCWVKAN